MLATIINHIIRLPKPLLLVAIAVPVIAMGAGGVVLAKYVNERIASTSESQDAGRTKLVELGQSSTESNGTNKTSASAEQKKTETAEKPKTESKTPVTVKKPAATSAAPSSGSGSATTAPSAPAPTCPNGTHTPGGSDGNGGCWPYAGNTGVPSGTVLTTYGGSCSIQSDTTIIGKTINCTLQVFNNSKLIVRNSVVNGFIDNTNANGVGTVTIEDSEVRAGEWVGGAMWGSGLFISRSELTGGQHSVHCESNCTVTDSWLHSQYNPDGGASHNNAFLSNGGGNMTLRHNTLHCTALLNATDGGCTGDLTLLGDFDEIRYVTADRNLMMANNSSIGFCVNAGYNPGKPFPNAHHMVFTNNVFQRGPNGKCGVYGAITSFNPSATGNVWSGNKWSDGVTLEP